MLFSLYCQSISLSYFTGVSFCEAVSLFLNWSGSGAFKVTNKSLIGY